MKTGIKITLGILVLIMSSIAGIGSSLLPLQETIFGVNAYGLCVEAPTTIEGECNASGALECRVYLRDTNEVVPAYGNRPAAFVCSMPLRKW